MNYQKINTVFQVMAVSLTSFLYAFGKHNFGIENPALVSVEMPKTRFTGEVSELLITMTKPTMDGNGFSRGPMYWTLQFLIIPRRIIGTLMGIPVQLEKHVIMPESFDIINIKTPKADDDYCPCDEEHLHFLSEHVIQQVLNDMEGAGFDAQTRTWTLGDSTWTVTP